MPLAIGRSWRDKPLPARRAERRIERVRPPRRQVLLPCYAETADMVAAAGGAVLAARLPPRCSLRLWLLDDGRDPGKAAWAAAADAAAPPGAAVRYLGARAVPDNEVSRAAVSAPPVEWRCGVPPCAGSARQGGARGGARWAQVDGRAGALNAGLAAAYAGGPPGARDALAVVHAHQTLAPAFFERALAALACDARLALVAPRQRAGNVDAAADVFGAASRARWARLLPGRAAWGAVDGARSGFLARPGALLVRARRGGRGAAARVSGWRGSGREQESSPTKLGQAPVLEWPSCTPCSSSTTVCEDDAYSSRRRPLRALGEPRSAAARLLLWQRPAQAECAAPSLRSDHRGLASKRSCMSDRAGAHPAGGRRLPGRAGGRRAAGPAAGAGGLARAAPAGGPAHVRGAGGGRRVPRGRAPLPGLPAGARRAPVAGLCTVSVEQAAGAARARHPSAPQRMRSHPCLCSIRVRL